MDEIIYSQDDLLRMLDSLLREPSKFWNDFYTDREKDIPFFTNLPDENLDSYFTRYKMKDSKVLEIGCGPGRNAIYMAKQGCFVDAVDLSKTTIEWAKERANVEKVKVNFIQSNIFDLNISESSYDFIYDSGCFHHIAPHRRMDYVSLVLKALKDDGYFGITCFVPRGELGGADITDWEVYRINSLMGGLGYSEEKLKKVFHKFECIEIRKMRKMDESNELFGVSGLMTALFKKTSF